MCFIYQTERYMKRSSVKHTFPSQTWSVWKCFEWQQLILYR